MLFGHKNEEVRYVGTHQTSCRFVRPLRLLPTAIADFVSTKFSFGVLVKLE